ncbi:HD-GYP domain-containing protein [Cohnella sp. REN36]|uniref:HD-GYP domain-containing protein n=1 Tax=Cohnella sp. REN36 TaxID=2887347 RepID=UPI001D155F2B|nr:HD-GYP domain-containing protein [Cohnella sp. REN36]MCC3372340.1 HD-GYP domain-containing protein [Cohnella sp. REN36]
MPSLIRSELKALGLRKDPATFSHSVRVGMFAQAAARKLGMSEDEKRRFTAACGFHDIGKLLVPHDLLVKRLPLDEAERARIREHPLLGERLIRQLGWRDPRMIATVRSHHERWDGKGYPDGLRGERIPPWARMCAVFDAFDAMVQIRSYNRVKTVAEAADELRGQSGIQFDKTCVELFLSIPEITIQKIQRYRS